MRKSSQSTSGRITCWSLLRHVPVALLLCGLQVLAVAPPGIAQGRTLEITSFHSDISVLPDGSLDVTERISVRFSGSWNGIFRAIPVEYRTDYGANYTLRIAVQSVRDDLGTDLRLEGERAGRNRVFRIWVPGASNAIRTVVFRYRVANGLRFFEEHDELYWNVTGDESEYPILAASATVRLPSGVDGVRSAAFAGPRGSVEGDVNITETANSIAFSAARPLRFREGLTVVVGWNPGVVGRPSVMDRALGIPAEQLSVLHSACGRWSHVPSLAPSWP